MAGEASKSIRRQRAFQYLELAKEPSLFGLSQSHSVEKCGVRVKLIAFGYALKQDSECRIATHANGNSIGQLHRWAIFDSPKGFDNRVASNSPRRVKRNPV